MAEQVDSVSGKIRHIIGELGPLGMLALMISMFIFISLFRDDFGGRLLNGSASTSVILEVEEQQKEKITTLFDSIEDVTIENIMISYETIADSSSTLFASNQKEQVEVRHVVILHQGIILAQYDVTRAISLLLDVPFHQVSLVNTLDITGGN